MTIIKTYEEFAPKSNLFLPPHKPEEKNEPNKIFFLKTLYESSDGDIIKTGNKINEIIKSGYYIKVKHIDTKMELIKQNEPCVIIGVKAGSTLPRLNCHIEDDSIVINVKYDDSFFILSINDNYQITFLKPKVIISEHDPYGEEDWGNDDLWMSGE